LDEHIIKSLLDQGAKIDVFGVGTSLVIGKEDAALDGVYKLSKYDGKPRVKISENIEKILIPGVKKLFRYYSEENKFYADAVVGEREEDIDQMIHPHQPTKRLSLSGLKKEALLNCVMKEGKWIGGKQTLPDVASYVQERLSLLPDEHKRFEYPHIYKVGASKALLDVRDQLVNEKLSFK
jgi:nicotinate phosphoribosyltransferase